MVIDLSVEIHHERIITLWQRLRWHFLLISAQLPYWSNNSFIKLLNFNTSISIPVKCYTFFYYTYLGGLDILVSVYSRSIWISIFLTNDSVQVAIKQEINVGLYDIVLDSFFQTLMRIFVITLIMEIDHNQQICISYALNLMPTPLSAGECSVACCGHRHVAYWLLISQAKSYVDLYVHTDIKIKKSRTRKEHVSFRHILHLFCMTSHSNADRYDSQSPLCCPHVLFQGTLLHAEQPVCYLEMNPLTVSFSAGLPGSGDSMSLILTQPAVPMPTTTAPNILTNKEGRFWVRVRG